MVLTLDDITLNPGERGIALGMTQTGKSTLSEHLIEQWRARPERSFTLIADTKPRFRGTRELDGRPCSVSGRYRKNDWGEEIPNSVVLPMHDPRSELRMARQLKYDVAIAQISERNYQNIMKVSDSIRYAYEDRTPRRPLYIYVDELNNFFRDAPRAAAAPIIMVLTSGAERHVSFLGAAQRPRHISIEAMESMTKLYWFYTPFTEDNRHLRNMGVPDNARPPRRYYQFYFFDRYTRREGIAQLQLQRTKMSAGARHGL
ncbi:MAG: hypothetical protein ACRETA_04450 [Gammaproteobacteria bacterium]